MDPLDSNPSTTSSNTFQDGPSTSFSQQSTNNDNSSSSNNNNNLQDQLMQHKDRVWAQLSNTGNTLSSQWQQHKDKIRPQEIKGQMQQIGQSIRKVAQDERTQQKIQQLGNQIQQQWTRWVVEPDSNNNNFTNSLETLNERMKEEVHCRGVRKEAELACLAAMESHLDDFLASHPDTATYEDWIQDLHPENTQDVTLLQGMDHMELDSRFYVQQSDHRLLWNERVGPERQVAARTKIGGGSLSAGMAAPPPDLLNDSFWPGETGANSTEPTSSTAAAPLAEDPFANGLMESTASTSTAGDPPSMDAQSASQDTTNPPSGDLLW